jgi:hypothetical protein
MSLNSDHLEFGKTIMIRRKVCRFASVKHQDFLHLLLKSELVVTDGVYLPVKTLFVLMSHVNVCRDGVTGGSRKNTSRSLLASPLTTLPQDP